MQRDLTDAWLRALKLPTSGRLEVWDKRVSGLVLRVTPNGAFTWSARARMADGRRTRPKLGSWPAMGISEARKQALAAVAAVQAGGDPVAAKRAAKANRQQRLAQPTVADRLAEWQAAKTNWSDSYRTEVARLCTVEIAPRLGKRLLGETTRADWTHLISSVHRRAPGVGALLYRVSSAFLNHAEASGWIPVPLLPRKGAAMIAPHVAARERALTDDELRRIWCAAAEKLNPKPRAFVHLLVMTAVRRMEAADITTGELDLDRRLWSIPASRTKNGRGIVVPLHPLLVAELRAVWPEHRERAGPNWRLLGGIAGSGLRGFSPIKRLLDKASGVAGWRWHDFRRSARTGLTRLGVDRDHAEAALNHVSGRTTLERTYDRHDYADEVIAALDCWQSHVARLIGVSERKAEVIPLSRRAREPAP